MSEAATSTTEQQERAATAETTTDVTMATTSEEKENPSAGKKTPSEENKPDEKTAEEKAVSTDDKKDDDIILDAVNMLAQGKRNLVCGEVPIAVNQLQEACKLLALKYGETADECAEAYFCYGKALLDLSRMESGVLGNALQGMSEEEEEDDKSATSSEDKIEDEKMPEEEREKISEQVIDAMLEREEEGKKKEEKKETTEEKDADGKKTDADKTDIGAVNMETNETKPKEDCTDKKQEKPLDKEDSADPKQEKSGLVEDTSEKKEADEKAKEMEKEDIDSAENKEGKAEMNGKQDTESEGKEGDTEEEGESEDLGTEEEEAGDGDGQQGEDSRVESSQEEDVSNLQLAWEMLELAKVIYRRHDTKDMKLKLAETNLKLGEVGLETEQYEQAVGDFHECLKLQQELLEPEDRLLAETYYQLGLASTYSCKYNEALESYKCAAKVIESKIELLNKILEEAETSGKGKEKADFDHPTYKADKEIKELQEILPDIMSKIEDVEDEKKSADKVKQLVKENVAQDLGTTTVGFGAATSPSKKDAASAEATASPTKSMASDISHLVRKKRKTGDEDETDTTSKKQKTENGAADDGDMAAGDNAEVANGHQAANGDTNGKSSPEKTEIRVKTVEEVKQKGEETMETS